MDLFELKPTLFKGEKVNNKFILKNTKVYYKEQIYSFIKCTDSVVILESESKTKVILPLATPLYLYNSLEDIHKSHSYLNESFKQWKSNIEFLLG